MEQITLLHLCSQYHDLGFGKAIVQHFPDCIMIVSKSLELRGRYIGREYPL